MIVKLGTLCCMAEEHSKQVPIDLVGSVQCKHIVVLSTKIYFHKSDDLDTG